MEIEPIAYIHTDFKEKFGIPRQSGRVPTAVGIIVFTPKYRDPESLKGIESFSHLWLLFDFSEAHRENLSPTVRPPRLGGNTRVGVFASRSPFRPNNIGLSCVRLIGVEKNGHDGMALLVSGVDLLDMTPIYDIKPYIPHSDCISDAIGGYADAFAEYKLQVIFPNELLMLLPDDKRQAVIDCLADDPRPAYQNDPERIYSMAFSSWDVRFTVCGNVLTVLEVVRR